jgi:hypothetical protein
MGKRYKRREFLTDAAVAAAGSVLLKLCAPSAYASQTQATDSATDNPDHTAH